MGTTLNFNEVRLRASPAYELVLYDRLSETERRGLQALVDDPECYGVLRPRQSAALSLKSVSRDVALLLFSLQTAGALPRFAAKSLGDECAAAIGKMILDGVLEMEVNGEMVSGPGAYALICGTPPERQREERALAAMSRRAIDYAAALELNDPIALSARLYTYNSVPASLRWRSMLPDDDATADYFGLLSGPAARSLGKEWVRLSASQAWISWTSKRSLGESKQNSQASGTFKLYISPGCDCLREAVEAIAEVIAESNARQWKIGKGVPGLLRPDKMLVYFREFADLQETALSLAQALEGCAPQGVPFTAELAAAGLLSWGSDPRSEGATVSWLERESWRVKICNQLALALIQARSHAGAGFGVPASQFALDRLRLEGIDTDTWTPSGSFPHGG